MSQSTPEVKFFNLHTSGLGYLSRIRHVDVKRGDGFLACDINALHGRSDDVEYTRFDCRVSGHEAITQIARCLDLSAQDSQLKILLGFCLSDLYVDTFVYRHGERQGQTGVSLKARLIRIDWIKVNGGRIIVEVRASVEKMVLSGIDNQLPEEVAFTEPDPVDSEKPN